MKNSLLEPGNHALLLIDHQLLQMLTVQSHAAEQIAQNVQIVAKGNPAALSNEQRLRYAILTKQLFAARRDVRELPDGYAIRLLGESANYQRYRRIHYIRACMLPVSKFRAGCQGRKFIA